ncbi:MAG TPA: methyltransferase domain-containing protein [Vicinamibacterales bacterium]|nr:methyltransferase domain-containing protein [Vicinamibacterales bacterium]
MTLRRINLALVLLGVLVAATWVRLGGGLGTFSSLLQASPLIVALMLGLTGLSVLVRFVRWQFLIRHAGVRLPARPSLQIYLASLVGTATPAYLGEAIRGAFIRRRFGVPLTTTLFVLVFERLLDVMALACLAGLTANAWWLRATMAAVLAAAVAGAMLCWPIARAVGVPETALAALRRTDNLADSIGMSLAAWLLPALHVSLAAASIGLWLSPWAGIRVFSSSVLLGGLTLMPAGIGSTGSLALFELEGSGFSLADSLVVVTLLRLTTVGATLAVGTMCLARVLRSRSSANRDVARHFDDIATEYGDQFKPHVWSHLLDRKVGLIARTLSHVPLARRGLDLGCGLGVQCRALEKYGYRVVGIDVSQRLVQQARRGGATVAAGSALALPFQDASLDFVYAIGVLHHLPDRRAQHTALTEIARVLKPGGQFLVHETNTRNPLFRLYMGYVFPLLKSIDEGTEWWIEPWQWEAVRGLRLVKTRYFTFMPDFTPAWMMSAFRALDAWLEAGRFRTYAVHYMAVLERDPSWSGAAAPARAAARRAVAGADGLPVVNAIGR